MGFLWLADHFLLQKQWKWNRAEQSRKPPIKFMGTFRSLLICSCDIQCFVNNIPRNREYLYIELLTVPVIWTLLFGRSVIVWLYRSMWDFFDLFFYLTFLLTSKGFTFIMFQWSTGKFWHISSLSRTEIHFWLFKEIKEKSKEIKGERQRENDGIDFTGKQAKTQAPDS